MERSTGYSGSQIQVTVDYPQRSQTLQYQLSLTVAGQKLELVDEAIENEQPFPGEENVYFYYRYQRGRPVINVKIENDRQLIRRSLRREDLIPDQSVLSQRKDPDLYPELSYLANQFSSISLYREWNIGRYSDPRNPQKTDLPEHPLQEDGSNLGLFSKQLTIPIRK